MLLLGALLVEVAFDIWLELVCACLVELEALLVFWCPDGVLPHAVNPNATTVSVPNKSVFFILIPPKTKLLCVFLPF